MLYLSLTPSLATIPFCILFLSLSTIPSHALFFSHLLLFLSPKNIPVYVLSLFLSISIYLASEGLADLPHRQAAASVPRLGPQPRGRCLRRLPSRRAVLRLPQK